jgi:hypothetical protein
MNRKQFINPCTPGPWTVTPHYDGCHEDPSHGVFFIEEVQAEFEKWYDASLDAEPNSCEEQYALDRRNEIQDSACRLIAAAPDLLDALHDLMDQLEGVGIAIEDQDSGQWHGAEGLSFAKARAAIKKATQP